jgi:hypothetical protein
MTQNKPFSSFKVVRLNSLTPDVALDLDNMDVDSYLVSRDESLVKAMEGMKPVWFHIGRLPAQYVLGLKSQASTLAEKAIGAFSTGCHKIEMPDGSVLEPSKVKKLPIKGTNISINLADDSWFQTAIDEFSYDTIIEIGQIVLDHASLSKDQRGPFSCWVSTVQKS